MFYKLLNRLAVIIKSPTLNDPLPLLKSLYELPLTKDTEEMMVRTPDFKQVGYIKVLW